MLSYRYFAAKEPLWARAVRQKTDMTSKALLSSILRRTKQVFQGVLKNKTQNVGVKVTKISKQAETLEQVVTYRSQLKQSNLYNVWQKILPKVYFRSLASELGRKAAWRSARNIPLFAFAGIVIAQHSEKEDEVVKKIHVRIWLYAKV